MSATIAAAPSRTAGLKTVGAGQAAVQGFHRIAQAWRLTVDEQMALLCIDPEQYADLSQGGSGALQPFLVERLSQLFAIYAAIQSLLPRPEEARSWVRRPLPEAPFSGLAPLRVMLSAELVGLSRVRLYLESRRR